MADFLPAPTYADVILVDQVTGRSAFNPIWLSWFLAVVQLINDAGGGGGGTFVHNDLTGLQGGSASERFHLDATTYNVLIADPNADRIIFWDDSASSLAHLTVGTGLNITTTTLTATITTATQTANQVFAGPTSGGAAAPTFRALVTADMPGISVTINSPFTSLTFVNGVLTAHT